MTSGVGIDPQEKVKLSRSSFNDTVEISSLEGRIKDIILSSRKGRVASLECPIEKSSLILALLFLRIDFILLPQNCRD